MRLSIAVVAGIALVVAGCSTSGHSGAAHNSRSSSGVSAPATVEPSTLGPTGLLPPTVTPPVPPTPVTPAASVSPTGPVQVGRGEAAPGTRLRFGQKAVVPIRQYDTFTRVYIDGVIGVVVEPIRSAPGALVHGNFNARDRNLLNTHTAYYAKVLITDESGNNLSQLITPTFDAIAGDGGHPDLAILGGEVPGCTDAGPSSDFDHKGAQWTTCAFGASSSARPITAFSYAAPPYGKELPGFPEDPPPQFNQYYGLGPLIWD